MQKYENIKKQGRDNSELLHIMSCRGPDSHEL